MGRCELGRHERLAVADGGFGVEIDNEDTSGKEGVGTCLVLSVFAWSQMVLTQFLCAGVPRSAHGTAEVGASSAIVIPMPA